MVTVKQAAVCLHDVPPQSLSCSLVLLHQVLGVARFLSKLCVAIIYSFFRVKSIVCR